MARVSTKDPLEKFRFLVDFLVPTGDDPNGNGTAPVRAGFHDIQMPKRTTNKVLYREGHDLDISSVSAGLSTMEDIVMSRGAVPNNGGAIANDFLKWASAVHKPSTGIDPNSYITGGAATVQNPGNNNYRSDVVIKLLDRQGEVERAWRLFNAFPISFVPGSDLNAGEDGEKVMEQLTLAYEDFQEVNPLNISQSLS